MRKLILAALAASVLGGVGCHRSDYEQAKQDVKETREKIRNEAQEANRNAQEKAKQEQEERGIGGAGDSKSGQEQNPDQQKQPR